MVLPSLERLTIETEATLWVLHELTVHLFRCDWYPSYTVATEDITHNALMLFRDGTIRKIRIHLEPETCVTKNRFKEW